MRRIRYHTAKREKAEAELMNLVDSSCATQESLDPVRSTEALQARVDRFDAEARFKPQEADEIEEGELDYDEAGSPEAKAEEVVEMAEDDLFDN